MKNTKVSIAKNELTAVLARAQKALKGDSNDAEHDALFALAKWLKQKIESDRRAV